jgi:hypothetical protein
LKESKSISKYREVAKIFIAALENFWDKYAVSSLELEAERIETLKTLDGFPRGVGYPGVKS